MIVVANTSTTMSFTGEVIVDRQLNSSGAPFHIRFSNVGTPAGAVLVLDKAGGSVNIYEIGGAVTNGPARTLKVQLQPMELQILD